ncbi:MAG: hypothetical protein Q9226_001044 [Calogaya cf. arnoldii]
MNSKSLVVPSRPSKRVDQASSIPQSTPKPRSESDNIFHGKPMTTVAVRGVPRKKEAPSSPNAQDLLDRQSAALAVQSNTCFPKNTAIPQPGVPLPAKPKLSVNATKIMPGDSAPRSKAIGYDRAGVSSSKDYANLQATAAKSNTGLTRHERSRSQVIPSRVPNQQNRVPSNESKDSRTETATASGRTMPQRSSKPSTSASISRAVISEADEGLPEEVRLIQRELLKLHILHSTSANNQTQWRTSAKAHFHKRFGALKERHAEIADIAYQTQELKNRFALVEWCRIAHGSEIGKRVHVLSNCICGVYDEVGFGGKYNQTIQTFQAWYDRARCIQESRKHNRMYDTADLGYVEEIGADWHNDVNALQRSLGTLTGDLRALGSASASSNLGQTLVLLHDLVIDMLTELDCIRSVEGELIAQERSWFDEQITMLSIKVHNERDGARDTPYRNR